MAHIVVRAPGRVPFRMELDAELAVGRNPDNGLVLDDPKVSRHHARIVAGSAGHQVVDAGSRHGTFVNGKPAGAEPLRDGDVIQLGNVVLAYGAGDRRDDGVVLTTIGATAGGQVGQARLLFDVRRAIGASPDGDELVGLMLEAALDILGGGRGLVGLHAGDGAARRIARGGDVDDIVLSRAVLAQLARGESILVGHGGRSAMAAPLEAGGRQFGYVYVDDRARADRFTASELDFLTALARLTAVMYDQAAERRRDAAVTEALRDSHPLPDILGRSPAMHTFVERVLRYAAAGQTSVLIRGESGSGKELVARTLHARSPRAAQPFVTVNCAAIPETLIESELFGHEKGAYTGAARARRGKFALADGGTLFLDEIGDLGLAAQAKVLRAVQDGEIQPLGSERILRVDVRLVSATHKSLDDEIEAGRFRQDLYYRLAVGELHVPPLRARGDDVLVLAEHFLAEAAARVGRPVRAFRDDAVAVLRGYGWPGNVRQLQNEIERAVILSDGPLVGLDDLSARLGPRAAAAPAATLAERWSELDVRERDLVASALDGAGGNVSAAARLLGVSRIMLVKRMARFGLGR
jgi:Nif-specific regulatory protein